MDQLVTMPTVRISRSYTKRTLHEKTYNTNYNRHPYYKYSDNKDRYQQGYCLKPWDNSAKTTDKMATNTVWDDVPHTHTQFDPPKVTNWPNKYHKVPNRENPANLHKLYWCSIYKSLQTMWKSMKCTIRQKMITLCTGLSTTKLTITFTNHKSSEANIRLFS